MHDFIASLPLGAQLLRFLPSTRLVITVVPIALFYATLSGWLAGRLRLVRGMRAPYTRKVFHFLIFTMASAVHIAWQLPGVVVFGVVVTLIVLYAVWRGDGNPLFEALARPTDAPHRARFVIIPLLTTIAGGLTSNLLFPSTAYVGYLVCGSGDAVGEPVGSRWGKHAYRVPSLSGVPAVRTLEGSLAVFVVGSLAAFLGLLANGHAPFHSLLVGAACGFAGAAVEAGSHHGLDNFTTQLAGAGVAQWLV
jgi:phytol kinase